MGDVVKLFNEITPEMAKKTIIDNLKDMHSCKWVNDMCAMRGLDDLSFAFDTLRALIRENIVEIQRIPLTNILGKTTHVSLYRYNVF